MIKIAYGACNSCLAKDGRELSKVEIYPTPYDSMVIRICNSCLADLREKSTPSIA